MIVFDFDKKKLSDYQLGHSSKVLQILWVPKSDSTFLSVSSDGYIILWQYMNDKWRPRILDVNSTKNTNLNSVFYHEKSHNRNQAVKTQQQVINRQSPKLLTCLEINPHKNEL